MKNAPDGGVFYFSRITFLQPPQGRGPTPARTLGLSPAPRCRSRPVGDGVLDVPPLRYLPAPPRSADPRPDAGMTADPVSPHQPCRGRRPRRPFPSSTAGPTASQGLRAAGAARKGGTPGEGPPVNPLLRFISKGAFRALRRAAKGSAPGPRPLFCKKAGQKTFKRQSTSSPSPSPLGRVMK